MPVYEIQAPDGRVFEIEGDREPTQQEMADIFNSYKAEPQRSFGEKIGGAVDAGLTMASSALAQPISGLVGGANLLAYQDPERAARRVEEVQQRLTYPSGELGQQYMQNIAELPVIKQVGEVMEKGSQQIGDVAYNLTGSPLAASIARAAPEAAGAYLGAKTPEIAANRLGDAAENARMAQRNLADENTFSSDTAATQQAFKAATKNQKMSNLKSMAEIIDADPEFYKALDALGITEQPLASYASRNPQFRGIEQSFAAMPSSPQHAQALRFAKDVSAVAKALDDKYTTAQGSVDASIKWRDAALKNIDQLGEAADEAYSLLGERIDKRAVAEPKEAFNFIEEQTKNLALGKDDPDVDPVIKTMLRSLTPRKIVTETGEQSIPPTYENIDQLRKKIGAAAFKKEGEFKDADSAILKRAYAALTKDTEAMAEAQGLVDEVKAAKALTRERKLLEERTQNLIGNKLQKDIVPVIQSGIKGLANGGAQRYQELMRNIPDEATRKELVYNAISDTFRDTLQGEKDQFKNTDFLKWYNETLGNSAVRKIVEKDLPEGALADFDNIAKIAKGMSIASSQKIKTGIVKAVLDDQMGFVTKMVKASAKKLGAAELASAVIEMAEKSTDRAAAASDMLADPRLQRLIANGYAQGARQARIDKSIEKAMTKEKSYQKWTDTLNDNDKRQLEALGFFQFVGASNQDEKPQ